MTDQFSKFCKRVKKILFEKETYVALGKVAPFLKLVLEVFGLL